MLTGKDESILTDEWVGFRTTTIFEFRESSVQAGHIRMSLELLYSVVVELFQEPSINKLCGGPAHAGFFSHITCTGKENLESCNM